MKLNKSILAVALGLSLASLGNAGTVYMTGSTAMRSIVYAALINPGTVFTAAPQVTTYDGSSASGANYMAFEGTLVGGSGTTVLQCHWSGSEAGILNVASNTVVTSTFIDPSLFNHAVNTGLPGSTVTAGANLAMGDNDQQYSRTTKPTLTKKAAVGVITFKWIRNKGLWTGTNVTDSQIRQAFSGFCPRAVFSGVDGQTNDFVYVSGRNNQSGTRVNAFGTCGYGILTIPKQIEMNNSGVMQDLDSPNGVYAGDYGYESGGTLCKTLQADTTAAADLWNGVTGYSVIAYGGVGDADAGIALGATELAYNGVPFSRAAVLEGTYGFWGNEFIFAANNVASGSEADKAFNLLAATTGINTFCDGIKAIKLTDMHCTRPGPTGDPAHN